ncbi:hypothetical protein GLOIN_2v1812804 [Rhizophagus irregularis DAOM 181602=DAOM 197198]|nr:hypothetical protein GLOIN_2v1812804 [Rhizophagus irregularis DAOM 181602=DAOM 197198]
MERYCGMLIPLISSRKLPYVNLINNVLLQERFKYLQFLPTYDEKYEFYSPCVNCKLTKNEAIKLKQCYAAIFQKNARDIRDIEESYMNSRNDYCVAINLTIDEQKRRLLDKLNISCSIICKIKNEYKYANW